MNKQTPEDCHEDGEYFRASLAFTEAETGFKDYVAFNLTGVFSAVADMARRF